MSSSKCERGRQVNTDCNDQGNSIKANEAQPDYPRQNVTLVVIWRRLLGPLLCKRSSLFMYILVADTTGPKADSHQRSIGSSGYCCSTKMRLNLSPTASW
ncbi:hypothetical protein T05_9773 [Trichinella murrelli]|uniref:Uncharacterized protein n=1 Tax=Trichinella murrelli TaxID=144512 RepID=A0A0V0TBL6_9BILA|nr:hypothetical protein T05_9773 [Trichinella murrelli]